MALSSELIKKFRDSNIPITTRLIAAKNLFISGEIFYLSRKEECVLGWLIEIIKSNSRPEIWETFLDCLSSNRMQNLRISDMKEETKHACYEILLSILEAETSSESIALTAEKCALHILSSNTFQYYFRKQVQNYIKLIQVLVVRAFKTKNAYTLKSCIKSLIVFNLQNSDKEDMLVTFTYDLLVPLIQAYTVIEPTEKIDIKNDIIHLLQRVVVCKPLGEQFEELLQNVYQCDVTGTETVLALFVRLLTVFPELSHDATVNLYTLVFEAFVSNSNSPLLYHLLVLICCCVGFEPLVQVEGQEKHVCLLSVSTVRNTFQCASVYYCPPEIAFSIVRNLVACVLSKKVPLDCNVRGVIFKKWLQELVLVSVSPSELTYCTFIIAECVVEMNPLVIETLVGAILKPLLLKPKKTEEVRRSYTQFLCGILDMHVKLQRVRTFLNYHFLPTLKKAVQDQVPSVCWSDVVPKSVCVHFRDSLPLQNSRVVVTVLWVLVVHLEKDIVVPMEEGNFAALIAGGGQLLYLEVVAQLLSHYLAGVCILEPTVTRPVADRFMLHLGSLRALLGRVGTALLLREHCSRAARALLEVTLACGEMAVLLRCYGPQDKVNSVLPLGESPQEFGSHPAPGLHTLHPFLQPEQWASLAQRIANFGDEACQKLMARLLVQRLCVLQLKSAEQRHLLEAQASIAQHVVEQAQWAWPLLLAREGSLLEPLLTAPQLSLLAEHTVSFLETGCCPPPTAESDADASEVTAEEPVWDGALLEKLSQFLWPTTVTQNWRITLALALCALKRIARLLNKSNKRKRDSDVSVQATPAAGQLVKKVVALLAWDQALQGSYKAAGVTLAEAVPQMAALINEALESELQDVTAGDGRLDPGRPGLLRCLRILDSLPLPFLQHRMRTPLFLAVLAVNMGLCNTDHFWVCSHTWLALLEGPGPPLGCALVSQLRLGALLRWARRSGPSGAHPDPHDTLLGHLLEASLVQRAWLPVLVEALLPPADLPALHACARTLARLLKKLREASKKEELTQLQPSARSLKKGILVFIKKHLKASAFSVDSMMDCFTPVLAFYTNHSPATISKLMPLLPAFLEAALQGLAPEQDCPRRAQSCAALLCTALEQRALLEEALPPGLVARAWAHLTSERRLALAGPYLAQLLDSTSPTECEAILGQLQRELECAVEAAGAGRLGAEAALDRLVAVWGWVVAVRGLRPEQTAQVGRALLLLCRALLLSPLSAQLLPRLLALQLAAARSKQMRLDAGLVETFLDTLVSLPHRSSASEFLEEAEPAVQLLSALASLWFPLLEDRLPAFLLALRRIAGGLTAHSNTRRALEPGLVERLANCAHSLERLAHSLTNRKVVKELVPYVLADLLCLLERGSVHPDVKVHLENSIYAFLRLCPKAMVSHLQQALPPGALELLKVMYREYNKFYRYTGKV